MNHPLITFGLTCFNAENSIERALESALAQDWPHFEVVVCDDASQDGSWSILQRLSNDKQIRIYRNEVNRGPSYSRNRIIAEAKGDFIAFMRRRREPAR